MQIIQLGHRKRQGKDTFATMLQDALPNSVITSFARPMKEILYETLNMTFEEGEHAKNINHTYRKFLQTFGSGKMKEYFGSDVWKQVLLKNLPECDYLIITDFRFPEEHIEEATTIKVHRDEEYTDTHISETALMEFDFDITILNNSSFEALEAKVDLVKAYLDTMKELKENS